MRKGLKITLIILGIFLVIIILDTLQSKIFDNSPIIKITENYNKGNLLKKDKGLFVYTYTFKNGEKITVYKWEKYSTPVENSKDSTNYESEGNKEMKSINIIINNEKYSAVFEDNETADEFFNLLPQEFNMKELNGNEKYVYMNYSLPTNSTNPKHITAGDIMLYGNNCLVIFYKSFDTNYTYTKIGHIDNLPSLGNGNINVKFEN